MFSQSTRLELAIVGAALLVLLLCRQPPKSGNAGVVKDTGPALQRPGQMIENQGQKTQDNTVAAVPPATGSLPTQGAQSPSVNPSSGATTSDNMSTNLAEPPQPKMKRMGVVDATKCTGLNYKDVMFGEVTARWVWDGQKDVLRKVCEVKEKDGTISTWIFDDRDDVVVTEIQPQQQ